MKPMARTVKNDEIIQRVPKGQTHPYMRWDGTPLWRAVEKAVADLVQNRDLVEDEYHEYIVAYICKIIDRRKREVITQLRSHSHTHTKNLRQSLK